MVLHREKGKEEAWYPVTDRTATRRTGYVGLMAVLVEEGLRRVACCWLLGLP